MFGRKKRPVDNYVMMDKEQFEAMQAALKKVGTSCDQMAREFNRVAQAVKDSKRNKS